MGSDRRERFPERMRICSENLLFGTPCPYRTYWEREHSTIHIKCIVMCKSVSLPFGSGCTCVTCATSDFRCAFGGKLPWNRQFSQSTSGVWGPWTDTDGLSLSMKEWRSGVWATPRVHTILIGLWCVWVHENSHESELTHKMSSDGEHRM